MFISTASIVVNSMRKRKKVMMMLDDCRSLTAAHVGSMSCIVHGCLPSSATIHPLSLAIYAIGTSSIAAQQSHCGILEGSWASDSVSGSSPKAESRRLVKREMKGMSNISTMMSAKNAMKRHPSPTMMRNAQKFKGTDGMRSALLLTYP